MNIPTSKVMTAVASLLALVATIVGLILLAWTVLYVTKGRFLKHTFEKYASRSAERDVRVAGDFQLYFNPIDIKFLAEGLTITNPKWAKQPYFLKSKLIDSNIESIPLISPACVMAASRVWIDLSCITNRPAGRSSTRMTGRSSRTSARWRSDRRSRCWQAS